MTGFAHLPLQQAIYQRLTADSTLMAVVSGVFDGTPQNSAFPYINFADSKCNDYSTKTSKGMEQRLELNVWSREGGRKQTASIMERIHTLLHDVNFSVTGHTLIMIRYLSSNIALEEDGWTYRGSMRFGALLEAN